MEKSSAEECHKYTETYRLSAFLRAGRGKAARPVLKSGILRKGNVYLTFNHSIMGGQYDVSKK